MSIPRWISPGWACGIALLLAGCADDPLVLKGQLQTLQQQQMAAVRQNQQMQERAVALDRNNQELESLLAQLRQRNQVLDEQLLALREQLSGTNAQLAQAREQKQSTEQKVQAMAASMRRQGGVTITPNSSLQRNLPVINLPGVQVRMDGDVVRVELPARELFENGPPRLRPTAPQFVLSVATELVRSYPEQIIGIEGHTDSDPVSGSPYRGNHELSVARATMIYDLLVQQARVPPRQLFIVGHGANHPLVSNATPAGKERNRRVELVVYPEKVSR